jgi:hypothetical protein
MRRCIARKIWKGKHGRYRASTFLKAWGLIGCEQITSDMQYIVPNLSDTKSTVFYGVYRVCVADLGRSIDFGCRGEMLIIGYTHYYYMARQYGIKA